MTQRSVWQKREGAREQKIYYKQLHLICCQLRQMMLSTSANANTKNETSSINARASAQLARACTSVRVAHSNVLHQRWTTRVFSCLVARPRTLQTPCKISKRSKNNPLAAHPLLEQLCARALCGEKCKLCECNFELFYPLADSTPWHPLAV